MFELVSMHGQKQLVNHFKHHDSLTTKDNLFWNLLNYCEAQKINIFGIVPLTFVLDDQKANFYEEMSKFEQVFDIFGQSKSKNN